MPPKTALPLPPPPPPAAHPPRERGPLPGQQPSGSRSSTGVCLAEQLRDAAPLRRVLQEELHDSSAVCASPLDTAEAVSNYQKYVQAFNIERWVQALGSATFETELVPITPAEARALISLHKAVGTEEDQTAVASMAQRLQRAMDKVTAPDDGCGGFVKTSSRSAKDEAEPEVIRKRYADALHTLGQDDENAQLVALSYASMSLLRVPDARQAMDIFVHSERCWHDMELALAQLECWDESLVARRWVTLEPDMEFRCFVSGGRLTAVSQYRHLVHFPRLLATREAALSGITSFFEGTVRPRLAGVFPREQYVLDLAVEVIGDGSIMQQKSIELGRWWCVEVNPFYETTDACLFSWSRERTVLEGAVEGQPEFRLRESPAKGALSMVYAKWKAAVS